MKLFIEEKYFREDSTLQRIIRKSFDDRNAIIYTFYKNGKIKGEILLKNFFRDGYCKWKLNNGECHEGTYYLNGLIEGELIHNKTAIQELYINDI